MSGGRNNFPQDVANNIDDIAAYTDEVEELLNEVVTELQDNENDLEDISGLLDELEDALASVGEDQVRVDIIDEGDVATEATLSSVNDFLDALEGALESTGTDELRVNTEPSEPITVEDFEKFEVDPDNSTETPLAANEEFVGEFKSWDQKVGLALALVADVPGGDDSEGDNSLKVDLSGDGTNVGRTIGIDYPPGPVAGQGIQPVISREAEFYRVRYQNGDQAQSTFRLNTIEIPRQLQEQLRPVGDTVNDRTVANTVKSIISARQSDGDYVNVGADRFGNLKSGIDFVGNDAYRFAPRGDVSLYGEQKVGSKVPQIEVQWWEEEDPEVTLDTTVTTSGTGTTDNSDGYASFRSGTDPNGSFAGQTYTTIDYLTSSEIKASFSAAWIQPPTSEGDYSMLGLSDGVNGFEIGYKGTTFGIRRIRDSGEVDFIPQSEFNGDKLDGNPLSEYERNNEAVEINHQTYDMWRIRYGWYGVAPTHIEVLAPDGHWVFVHKFDFTEEQLPQTDQPDLPIRTYIDKDSSDSTDIEQRVSAFFGGVIANVQLAQQPDGDYVSQKATGEVITEENLLTANEEFISDWYGSDGWGSIGVSLNADQESAEDGLVIEYTNDTQRTVPEVKDDASFTFTQEDVIGEENLYIVLTTQLDGFRVRYKNGNIGQNDFSLNVTLFESTRPRQTNLNTPVPNDAVISTNRSIVFAENDDGDIEKVHKAEPGDGGGLRTAISEHETDTPTRPDDKFDTTQVSVPDIDGGGPIQPLNGGLDNRTSVRVANGGDQPVYIGSDSTVRSDSGYEIDPDDDKVFPISDAASFWLIAEDAVGSSNTYRLDPTVSGVTGTATNPDNVISSDDSRAIFDANGEFVEASGYDATGQQALDEVSSVRMGFEAGRGEGGLRDITYEETESNIQTGGTSVSTANPLTSDPDSFYVATVSVRDDTVLVNSVTGLGLTWTQRASGVQSQGVRTEVWTAQGDPTGDDNVTANFNATVATSAIGVSRLNGVSTSDPVTAFSGNTGVTQNWTVGPSPNESGDFIIGGAGLIAESTNNPGTGDTERLELTQGGGNANRMTFAVHTDNVTSTNEELNGSWGTTDAWAGAAIALNQEELGDPFAILEYEVDGVLGSTSLTTIVDTTSDTDYEEDITGDMVWTYSDIDNITLRLTDEDGQNNTLEVDHLYIDFTEVDTGSTQRVSFMETGRTGDV